MATLIIIMSISRDSGKTIAKYMYIKKRLNIQSKLAILNLKSILPNHHQTVTLKPAQQSL